MRVATLALLAASALAAFEMSASAQQKLTPAIVLPDAITNGAAIAPGGRTFLAIAKQKGQDVPQIAEWKNKQLVPFPDASWNSYKPGDDAATKWIHANSIRFSADGALWVVDTGAPGFGQSVLPHGGKLVAIDIATGKVTRTLLFDKALKPNSFLDDVRFNGDYAYLTDAGAPGLIVVHMPDGSMTRELDGATAATALSPMRAEGRQMSSADGKPIKLHADQLEVSPDGKTLYFCPASGPLSAIDTQYLDNVTLNDAERVKHVRKFADTGTTGGTAIDSRGNVYVSQPDQDSVLKITPAGVVRTLVKDPRLIWVDAMYITSDGRLWMPAAQLNRTPDLNGGKYTVQFPMTVFTTPIGNGPPVNDHR